MYIYICTKCIYIILCNQILMCKLHCIYIYISLFVNVINIYKYIYIYIYIYIQYLYYVCSENNIYIYTNYIIKLCNQIYVLYWGFCIYTYIQHIFELNEYTKHGKLVMSQTMVRIERECNWKPWKHGDMIKIWKNKWWLNINIWQH